jgi:hypothetical protein
MKKFFPRLLPVMGLLCLPLFGGYHPAAPRESLRPDEAQLAALSRNTAYQAQAVTRDYFITIVATAPKEKLIDYIRDFGPFADYRFFSMLTNFRHKPLSNQGVIARTTTGTNFKNTLGPYPAYVSSNTYKGYGRFCFNVGKKKVHDFYGRDANGNPFTDQQYLNWVSRDMLIRATGEPYQWLPAAPAGW